MPRRNAASPRRAGFTLVELAVVIVSIGTLAASGVPRFLNSVEQARASEAFEYLASVRVAQERHQLRYGTYAARVADLDIKAASPRCFAVPDAFSPADTPSLEDSWSLTLTRAGSSAGHGAYTVIFTQAGFDRSSAIASVASNSEINPLGR